MQLYALEYDGKALQLLAVRDAGDFRGRGSAKESREAHPAYAGNLGTIRALMSYEL